MSEEGNMDTREVLGFLAKAQAHADQFPSDDHYTIRKWNIIIWLVCAVVEALILIAGALVRIGDKIEERP